MAQRFWTADWHLGHSAIIGYCDRPFKDAEHMIKRLIANANMRVKAGDTLISVGDFACYGRAKGIEGLRLHASEYIKQLNGTFVNVEGNHDANNKVKSICDMMLVRIGKFKVSVAHHPSWQMNIDVKKCLDVDFHICGHVHEKFKHAYSEANGLLNINVGCDVWNYMPVNDSEIIGYVQKVMKETK
jgi:calcineurin-like phosphoesterase family protein